MNYLVEDLLKIHTPHHTQIQRQIMNYFARCGYESRTEKKLVPSERSDEGVWRDRKSRNGVLTTTF